MDQQKEGNIKKTLQFSHFFPLALFLHLCGLRCFGEIFHDSLWLTAGLTKCSEDMKGYL